jgi:hypothetical protein
MRKSLFNYSFYSHSEIGKFQGVTHVAQLNEESRHAAWRDQKGYFLQF